MKRAAQQLDGLDLASHALSLGRYSPWPAGRLIPSRSTPDHSISRKVTVVNLLPIISNALVFGVVLGSILFTTILVVVRINPETMLRDYPPDVQAEHGPMSDRSKRQKFLVTILVLAEMFGVIVASLAPILDDAEAAGLFPTMFVHFFVMFSVFNVLDWLVLDWLIVVSIRPSFLILPGTEGMAGYRDYAFHFRGFLIGIPITLAASLLLAALVNLLR